MFKKMDTSIKLNRIQVFLQTSLVLRITVALIIKEIKQMEHIEGEWNASEM